MRANIFLTHNYIPMFDAHTHLNAEQLFPDRELHLSNFVQKWGQGLINIGANETYNLRAIQIAQQAKDKFPDLKIASAIGLHPWDLDVLKISSQQALAEIKSLYLDHPSEVLAIGEIGMDFHYPVNAEQIAFQEEIFDLQCQLARELKLPIVIHSRDAFDTTFQILKNYPDLKTYFHCRWYGPEELKILQDTFPDLYVGYTGNITYQNAHQLRASLEITPLEQLILETDAPYLSPQISRGTLNTPGKIKEIWLFVANFLKLNPQTLWQQLEHNFHQFYHFPR